MKILIVSQYFWPENFRINDLTQELEQRGHEVTVLTGIPNYPAGVVFESYRLNPMAYRKYGNATILRAPIFVRGFGGLRLLLNYVSFAVAASIAGPWLLRRQVVDIIFVFEPSPVTVGLPAVLIGKIKKVPVVFWALDLWPETLEALGVVRSPKLLGLVGYLVRFIYARCTLVLGQSRGFLGSIAKYCHDVKKIRYFPSWAENIFVEFATVPAPEIPALQGGFNVLFAGNVGEAQDLPSVLDAAELLKNYSNIRWLIVGDGRMSNWLRQEVICRGLQDQVLLLGRFPVERMPSFYARADALLVSLKKDPVFSMTIPGKVQSYLLSGVPIVAMLDGEGARVVAESNAGLVCPAGEAGRLAENVLALMSMPLEKRVQLGLNGRSFAQKEFDRTLLIDRLESLFKEAVQMFKQDRGLR